MGGGRPQERDYLDLIQEGMFWFYVEALYLQELGVVSCGRARGAPKPGQPLPTFAVWIRSSPRRRTRGSGYPAVRKAGKSGAPESQTGQVQVSQLSSWTHPLRQATPMLEPRLICTEDPSLTSRTKPPPPEASALSDCHT